MSKTYTLNYIVLYLYGELPPDTAIRFMEEIMRDPNLMEEFEFLAEVKEYIDKDKLVSPSNDTLFNILREATVH